MHIEGPGKAFSEEIEEHNPAKNLDDYRGHNKAEEERDSDQNETEDDGDNDQPGKDDESQNASPENRPEGLSDLV